MHKKSWVHYVTKIVVDIMFYGGIIICLLMPYFAIAEPRHTHGFITRLFPNNFYGLLHPYNTSVFLSGLCVIYILWQFKKMLKSLLGGNPFVAENIKRFRKMAVASLIIAVLFAIRGMFFWTITSALIVIIFSVATLFCLTLKDVFKQAVYYKEENDGVI